MRGVDHGDGGLCPLTPTLSRRERAKTTLREPALEHPLHRPLHPAIEIVRSDLVNPKQSRRRPRLRVPYPAHRPGVAAGGEATIRGRSPRGRATRDALPQLRLAFENAAFGHRVDRDLEIPAVRVARPAKRRACRRGDHPSLVPGRHGDGHLGDGGERSAEEDDQAKKPGVGSDHAVLLSSESEVCEKVLRREARCKGLDHGAAVHHSGPSTPGPWSTIGLANHREEVMRHLAAIWGCCVLALSATTADATCTVEPRAGGKLRQFSPAQHPLPGRESTEITMEVDLETPTGECMVGIGLGGGYFSSVPPSVVVESAVLERLDTSEPRRRSVVLPFIAQSRGALLWNFPTTLPDARWWGFTGELPALSYPLQPNEVFVVRFVVSFEPEDINDLRGREEGVLVQFSGGGVLPDGSPDLGAGGPDPTVYSEVRQLGECFPTQSALCLNGGRFRVVVDWRTAAASGHGLVDAFATNDVSSNLTFFESSNVELTIKILDGRPLNGHCWVFHSAMTDVGYTLTVTDTQTGRTKTYSNPLGQAARPVLDTSAFECG